MGLAEQLAKKAAGIDKEAGIPGGRAIKGLLGLFGKAKPGLSQARRLAGSSGKSFANAAMGLGTKAYSGPVRGFPPPPAGSAARFIADAAGNIKDLGSPSALASAASSLAAPSINTAGYLGNMAKRTGSTGGKGMINWMLSPQSGKGGLARLGLGAVGAGALNEGLSAIGLPSISPGGDPAWSPQLQGLREQSQQGFLDSALGWLARPIQSTFRRGQMPRTPEDLVTDWTHVPKTDANGNVIEGAWDAIPQYANVTKELAQQDEERRRMWEMMRFAGGRPQKPPKAPMPPHGPVLPPMMQVDPMQLMAAGASRQKHMNDPKLLAALAAQQGYGFEQATPQTVDLQYDNF